MTKFHVKLYAKAVESRKLDQIQKDFEKKFNRKIDVSVEYCYHVITQEVRKISCSIFKNVCRVETGYHSFVA